MNQQEPHATRHAAAPQTRGSVIHWAGLYDLIAKVMTLGKDAEMRRRTIELAGVRPAERILDIGCGTGTLALLAKEAAGEEGEVCGVDASPEMIARAQQKAAKAGAAVDFRTGLIEDIPFLDGHFDLALSSFMLHHLPDDLKRQGFVEIARVLKPGGRVLAIDVSGRGGSLLAHLLSLTPGHRIPADYFVRLAEMAEDAGLSSDPVPTDREPYAVLRARKA